MCWHQTIPLPPAVPDETCNVNHWKFCPLPELGKLPSMKHSLTKQANGSHIRSVIYFKILVERPYVTVVDLGLSFFTMVSTLLPATCLRYMNSDCEGASPPNSAHGSFAGPGIKEATN